MRHRLKFNSGFNNIFCFIIILAVIVAGIMVPNGLLAFKSDNISGSAISVDNTDVEPYTNAVTQKERLSKIASLINENVNNLWIGDYTQKREPLDMELSGSQAYKRAVGFLEQLAIKQEESGLWQIAESDTLKLLTKASYAYTDVSDSQSEVTSSVGVGFSNTVGFFVTSESSRELSAWAFFMSLEDINILIAVDAVLGVPVFVTYYCDVDSAIDQAYAVRDTYAALYGGDYSMSDPVWEDDSQIDKFLVENSYEGFYYGNVGLKDDKKLGNMSYELYSCQSNDVHMEYQMVTLMIKSDKYNAIESESRVSIWVF